MKQSHHFMTLVLISVFAIMSKVATAHDVNGLVKDESGRPMPYATVHLHDLHSSVTTDLTGCYHFTGIPSGNHQLSVSFIGYKTVQQGVAVQGNTTVPDVGMVEEAVQLSEMIVLPKGMTMEEYILRQVNKNIVPLKKRLPRYRASVTCRMEKNMDLTNIPRRRTLKAAAWVLGFLFERFALNNLLCCILVIYM